MSTSSSCIRKIREDKNKDTSLAGKVYNLHKLDIASPLFRKGHESLTDTRAKYQEGKSHHNEIKGMAGMYLNVVGAYGLELGSRGSSFNFSKGWVPKMDGSPLKESPEIQLADAPNWVNISRTAIVLQRGICKPSPYH